MATIPLKSSLPKGAILGCQWMPEVMEAPQKQFVHRLLRAFLRGLAAHNHGHRLCLVTTRQHLPELATANSEIRMSKSETNSKSEKTKSGTAHGLLLAANGFHDSAYRFRSSAFGFPCRVDFLKVNEKEKGDHAFRVIAAYERWFEESNFAPNWICESRRVLSRQEEALIGGMRGRQNACPECLTTHAASRKWCNKYATPPVKNVTNSDK
ncbi:MAG: hypothetical protein AAB676_15755 [Verrucomicrobiota bacterium]